MARASIPVDPFNPGQVFACMGFLEAADVLLGDARGGFDWSAPDGRVFFHLEAEGGTNPVEAVLEFLASAKARAVAPKGSSLRDKDKGIATEIDISGEYPCPAPATPSALPAILIDEKGRSVSVSHWADGCKSRDSVKFWAGMGGYSGSALLRDLLRQASECVRRRAHDVVTNPLNVSSMQSSSLRFDIRSGYVPLDLGFSLNQHSKMNTLGYPFVDVLSAVGLEYSRPKKVNKLQYEYAVWDYSFPTIFARSALGGETFGFLSRRFSMTLGWPGQEGQARCILFAQEELRND